MILFVLSSLVVLVLSQDFVSRDEECDILIIGGSLSAFSAAISASSFNISTCLVEPTDWIGGQTTSSGVPAIDFCWHTLKSKSGKTFPVYKYCRKRENITPSFYNLLQQSFSNTGKCWVSTHCFLPQVMIQQGLQKIIQERPHLKIFYNSVIKRVEKDGNMIKSAEIITRYPKKGKCGGWDHFLHEDIEDWYSRNNSTRFTKNIIQISAKIFIEASEWGELLVLSEAPYLQGLSERYDGDISQIGNSSCGQSIVFGFTEKYTKNSEIEPPNPYPILHPDYYSFSGYSWDKIFTYRRLFTSSKFTSSIPQPNDITLQNWGKGNDDPFNYLFKNFEETKSEVEDWKGGISLKLLEDASFLAYGWHYDFKNTESKLKDHIIIQKNENSSNINSLGTCTGLSKVPYIRDTRRTIGINNFIMNVSDISGDFIEKNYQGTVFNDRVALGCYDIDIHSLESCSYPEYITKIEYPVLPFYIPFRAMTNKDIGNLLVTGKCIGQSFLVSAASRTHPTEYSTGTASGAIAAWMVKNNVFDVNIVYSNHIQEIKSFVEQLTPIDWDLK